MNAACAEALATVAVKLGDMLSGMMPYMQLQYADIRYWNPFHSRWAVEYDAVVVPMSWLESDTAQRWAEMITTAAGIFDADVGMFSASDIFWQKQNPITKKERRVAIIFCADTRMPNLLETYGIVKQYHPLYTIGRKPWRMRLRELIRPLQRRLEKADLLSVRGVVLLMLWLMWLTLGSMILYGVLR